jgi:cyclopropane fatty-acyl-phospholipid synthase-like methyltransferase
MKGEIQKQSEYWSKESAAFESIYTHKKSKISSLLDQIFRKDMYERYDFTIQNCEPVKGRSFLDIGSGNGKYSIELAKRGAEKVLGLDVSENMVKISQENAKKEKVDEICSFIIGELITCQPKDVFDIAIGIGLFDYVSDALPLLTRMNEVVKNKVIVSFPRFWTWRAPIRKIRLFIKGCPVYFYRKSVIDNLMKKAGFTNIEFHTIGKLFCIIADKK